MRAYSVLDNSCLPAFPPPPTPPHPHANTCTPAHATARASASGRFKEAEAEFISGRKPREAIDMYLHQQDWNSAMRVAEQYDPASMSDVLVAQGKLAVEVRRVGGGRARTDSVGVCNERRACFCGGVRVWGWRFSTSSLCSRG